LNFSRWLRLGRRYKLLNSRNFVEKIRKELKEQVYMRWQVVKSIKPENIEDEEKSVKEG